MGKIGGIILVAAFALGGCSAPAAPAMEPASEVRMVGTTASADMLTELRPLLKKLDASDEELVREAFIACGNLAFRDKDAYREAVLAKYPNNQELGLDHLTVAAAGKQHLCR